MIPGMEPTVRFPRPPSHVRVPPELEGLRRLAYNLYWTWHPQGARAVRPDQRRRWARTHSPIPVLLSMVDWPSLLDDPDFMVEAQRRHRRLRPVHGQRRRSLVPPRHARELEGPIAYFCAEYGLHESMGIYSGGLGVLAGDHMKAASDMALPLVGVGLLYRNGYFRQTIDADGHQEHRYPDYDLARLPLTRALGREGDPLTVSVELPGRSVHVDVWTVQVGRVPVLLLDTDNPINDPADRPITHILYVRGREMRLHQELILGVGGVRALRALGIEPDVWHLNEGHSAFLLAERARIRIAAGDELETALRRSRATACSRSTRRSRRATSDSTPISCAASQARSSTATAGATPAACPSSASWRSGGARTATRASST